MKPLLFTALLPALVAAPVSADITRVQILNPPLAKSDVERAYRVRVNAISTGWLQAQDKFLHLYSAYVQSHSSAPPPPHLIRAMENIRAQAKRYGRVTPIPSSLRATSAKYAKVASSTEASARACNAYFAHRTAQNLSRSVHSLDLSLSALNDALDEQNRVSLRQDQHVQLLNSRSRLP